MGLAEFFLLSLDWFISFTRTHGVELSRDGIIHLMLSRSEHFNKGNEASQAFDRFMGPGAGAKGAF